MARRPFGLNIGGNVAAGGAADLTGAGDGHECEDEQAVAEVAEPVAREHRDGEQAPEGGVAETLGVCAVAKSEDGEGREGKAREDIDEAERDHALASCFFIRFSRRRRRRPWMMKAAIAVGIAQSEKCSGSMI